MERIFSLALDIKKPDIPFELERSIRVESGNLIEVLARFPLELAKLLRELHEKDLKEQLELHGVNEDDIPF